MTKKLNIEAITNELQESAFFPRPKRGQPEGNKSTSLPENPTLQEEQSIISTHERENARSPVRPNGRRIITRNSFEIYEDQMDSLRKLSLQKKMEGKLGSMSQMVREAIDAYLKDKASSK